MTDCLKVSNIYPDINIERLSDGNTKIIDKPSLSIEKNVYTVGITRFVVGEKLYISNCEFDIFCKPPISKPRTDIIVLRIDHSGIYITILYGAEGAEEQKASRNNFVYELELFKITSYPEEIRLLFR